MLKYAVVDCALGDIVLFARERHLSRLDLLPSDSADGRQWVMQRFPEAAESPGHFDEVALLLRQYFEGRQVEFKIPVDLSALRPFTALVLDQIRKIAYGKVASYGMIARQLGYSNASRAVGQALKRNPIPIIIPCHRVVKGDASLGGFGMGIEMKVRLLSIEGVSIRELRKSMVPS